MKNIALIFAILFLSGVASAQNAGDKALEINKAVVTLKCVDVLGYGFFVDKDLVVTNYQIINKARVGAARAVLAEGEISMDVMGFVASDLKHNLVLLKVNYDKGEAMKLSENPVQNGQNVTVLHAVGENKIKTVRGNITEPKDYGEYKLLEFRTEIKINSPGLPLLDESGAVIGISISPIGKDTLLNYAVPVNFIRELIARKTSYVRELKELLPPEKMEKEKKPQKSELVTQYLNQGNARIYSKDYKGAIEKFNLAIKQDPYDADAYIFRGQAEYYLMDYKSALADFNKAIEIQPDYAEAYDLRGIVKRELGDHDGACQDWLKSFELGFDHAFQLLKKFCDLEKYK